MSKLSIRQIKRSYKDTVKEVLTEYIKAIITKGDVDDELAKLVTDSLNRYSDEMEAYIEKHGDTIDLTEWKIEALNELRMGDIIMDAIGE